MSESLYLALNVGLVVLVWLGLAWWAAIANGK